MKKWIWLLGAIIIVVLVLIGVGIYTSDKPTWVIAVFTIVLAVATTWNIFMTGRVLKQSEQAAKELRAAFLINVVNRTIQDITQPLTDGRISEFAGSFAGKLAIIDRMDKEAAKEILEALDFWCNEASGGIKIKCNKFLDKYKELLKQQA